MNSNEISKRIRATEKAESKIQETRKHYLPLATRGALLYFLVEGLARVSCAYQFSLDWFHQVFLLAVVSGSKEQEESDPRPQKTLDTTDLSEEPTLEREENISQKHLKNSIDVLTRSIFKVRHPCTCILHMDSMERGWSNAPFSP